MPAAPQQGRAPLTSASNKDAATGGKYYKGIATFIVVMGGLMVQASVGGQKFNYKRL